MRRTSVHVMILTGRSYTSTTNVLCHLKQASTNVLCHLKQAFCWGHNFYCGCAGMTHPSVSLGERLYKRA